MDDITTLYNTKNHCICTEGSCLVFIQKSSGGTSVWFVLLVNGRSVCTYGCNISVQAHFSTLSEYTH